MLSLMVQVLVGMLGGFGAWFLAEIVRFLLRRPIVRLRTYIPDNPKEPPLLVVQVHNRSETPIHMTKLEIDFCQSCWRLHHWWCRCRSCVPLIPTALSPVHKEVFARPQVLLDLHPILPGETAEVAYNLPLIEAVIKHHLGNPQRVFLRVRVHFLFYGWRTDALPLVLQQS